LEIGGEDKVKWEDENMRCPKGRSLEVTDNWVNAGARVIKGKELRDQEINNEVIVRKGASIYR
jgi:hypothetical protein